MSAAGALSTRAMLTTLSISMWRCHKRDKDVSREVAARHGTSDKAGAYNKNLLPLDETNSYHAVEAVAAAAYEHFRAETLPWLDDGARICPAANYLHLADVVRKDRAAFEVAVEVFRADLPALVEQARSALNGLFRDEDYPSPADVGKKFSLTFRVLPLPDAADFRVEISDEEAAAIRAQIDADSQTAAQTAMADLYRRLHERVGALHRALTGEGAVRKPTLAALRELCDTLPRLNLTGDAALDAMHGELLAVLDATSEYPEAIAREDLTTRDARAAVKAKVAGIMDRMSAFMVTP